MKAESNIKPVSLAVERVAGGIAEVVFRENITEETRKQSEGSTVIYTYDEYRTAVPYRDNLLQAVKKAKAAWLARAKSEETVTPKPSLEQQVAALQKENAKLREDNDIIAAALEETIAMVLGGGE